VLTAGKAFDLAGVANASVAEEAKTVPNTRTHAFNEGII
jgi:hypothetical protein